MNNKKKLIFLGLDVLVLVITIGVSLAVFNYVGKGENPNIIKSGYITMNFVEGTRNINIPVIRPTEDEIGKTYGLEDIPEENKYCTNNSEEGIQCYSDFIVSTNMNLSYPISYEVTLEKDSELSTLEESGVRIYLEKYVVEDGEREEDKTYEEVFSPKEFTKIDSENPTGTDELGASNSEMLLDSGSVTKSVTYHYRLRMWLASDYTLSNESVTFSAKVSVYGSNVEVNAASGITLDKTNLTMQKGTTNTLTATIKPDNAKNKNLIWESSNSNVVKVDSAGNLTAVEVGTSTITVRTSDRSYSVTSTITVVNYDATGITLNTNSITLPKGNTEQLTATLTPPDAEHRSVTYRSSSEGIATISNNGLITAVGVGETTITAETENGITATCKVIVTEANVATIAINGNDSVDVGDVITLTTSITTTSGTTPTDIVWTSSDESKAIVTSGGKVTGIEPTEEDSPIIITAYVKSQPDLTATKEIIVQYPEIKSITMSSDMTIYTENSTTFVIWTNPNEVSNQSSIEWISSNTSVATIQENCKGSLSCTIIGNTVGSTIITAKTSDSISVSANLNVVDYVNSPELRGNMVPIKYNGSNWVKADSSNLNNSWYDYNNRIWANAVTLTSAGRNNTYNVGDVIPSNVINAYWVWIPRYSYTIKCDSKNTNCYGHTLDSTGSTPSQATPGAIDIKFESGTSSSTGTGLYTGNTISGYYTPPGFTFDNKDLKGVWISKFELTGTTTAPTSLPGVTSLRNQSVKNLYTAINTYMNGTNGSNIYGLSGNYDTHMARNSEWSLLSYLSQSKYGKYGDSTYNGANKEIYQNKNSDYLTGHSHGKPSGTDSGNDYTYSQSPSGTGASTTGNIYGIYDTSGGAWEYVMTAKETKNSDWTEDEFNALSPKYLEILSSYERTTACNDSVCKGQNLNTTARWYDDYDSFIDIGHPWISRGNSFDGDDKAGIFSFHIGGGGNWTWLSARIILSTY